MLYLGYKLNKDGDKDADWKAIKTAMADMKFLEKLKKYDKN